MRQGDWRQAGASPAALTTVFVRVSKHTTRTCVCWGDVASLRHLSTHTLLLQLMPVRLSTAGLVEAPVTLSVDLVVLHMGHEGA